nr:E3 ubiquitin-protein ligase RFWD3 [Onthophagus taurus]
MASNANTEDENIISSEEQETETLPSNENTEIQPLCSQETVVISQQDEDSNSSNQSVSKKRRLDEDFQDDDGMTCSICLDNWTNSGDHSICSLKCGHLFGHQCIMRWLSEQKVCPTCKRKASGHDIRFIYARKLVAVDTTDLTLMKTQLQLAQEEKNKLQMELTKNICREHSLLQKIQNQKVVIDELKNKLAYHEQLTKRNNPTYNIYNRNQAYRDQIKLYRDKTIDLGKDCESRVVITNSGLDLAVVSSKSQTNFFTGYGIRKYNVTTYKPTAFIGLHTAKIRDMKFHNENPWILTAAMDKTSTIVDFNNNIKVLSISCDAPIWSCCWDQDISPIFYLGTNRGMVLKYDMRNPSQILDTLESPGDMSPVVSIQGVKRASNQTKQVGILSCKLRTLWFFTYDDSKYAAHPLPIEGPFSSMTYDTITGHMLVSARPSDKNKSLRHLYCTLTMKDDVIGCNALHTINGGYRQTVLSRSHLFNNYGQYAVAAYVEDTKTTDLWSLNSGKKMGGIAVSDYVYDICSVQSGNNTVLLALTGSKLEFFKFS